MRDDEPLAPPERDDLDPPCFTVRHDDSSRNVTDRSAPSGTPSTSAEAVRLAIKLAVDAGEYERAHVLLDVLKRAPLAATVTDIAARRRRSGETE